MPTLEKNTSSIIEATYPKFTDVERRIADYFLEKDQSKSDLSAQTLAKELYVSVPSLTRFAQKCGFSGYRQFVFSYQQDQQDSPNVNRELTKKVLADYSELLKKTYSLIDEEQFLRIGQLLDQAQIVYIYGLGSSGLVAREMEFRFMRLGMTCKAVTDDHMIRMNQVTLDANCLVIGLSMSGKSKSILGALSHAKEVGAKTVLLTSNTDEKLFLPFDELVLVSAKKMLEQGKLISPQFPMLVVLDIFYAYYLDLNKQHKQQLFSHTLSVLEE